MSAPVDRPRRSLAHKLGAVVLGFESLVVFLAGLTVFGLGNLPDAIPQFWAIIGGAVVAVAMILTAGLITRPGAIAAGWVLQGVVVAATVLVPAILLVALVFGTMWGYATIAGARIDARKAAASAAPDSERE